MPVVTITSGQALADVISLMKTADPSAISWGFLRRIFSRDHRGESVATKFIVGVVAEKTIKELKRRYNPSPNVYVTDFGIEPYRLRDRDYPYKFNSELEWEPRSEDETYSMRVAIPFGDRALPFNTNQILGVIENKLDTLVQFGLGGTKWYHLAWQMNGNTLRNVFINVHRDSEGSVPNDTLALIRLLLNGSQWMQPADQGYRNSPMLVTWGRVRPEKSQSEIPDGEAVSKRRGPHTLRTRFSLMKADVSGPEA